MGEGIKRMKTKRFLIGAATAIGLFGTTVSTMAANPTARDWVIAACAALAAGLMAALNPDKKFSQQLKKDD